MRKIIFSPPFEPITSLCLWLKSTFAILAILWAGAAATHEVLPAVADVFVEEGVVEIELYLTAESLMAGVDLSKYTDTNDAPQTAEYDRLRAMMPADLQQELLKEWPNLRNNFLANGAGPFRLLKVVVADEQDLELPRDTLLLLQADIDKDAAGVSVGWPAKNGALVVRHSADGKTFATLLDAGEMSTPIPLTGGVDETGFQAFVRFVIEGFEHILPKGLDHILFVLGLFLFSLAWRPLLSQVTAFTLAHTVTLGAATVGVISIPASAGWIVESLIAASIVYVGVENIFKPKLGWWRIVIVFGFGLLHGLGFASVLGDLGLSQGNFIISLIAFNIGVEIGQLTVIGAAFVAFVAFGLTLGRWPALYRRLVVIPGSLLISAIGAYWVIERTLL